MFRCVLFLSVLFLCPALYKQQTHEITINAQKKDFTLQKYKNQNSCFNRQPSLGCSTKNITINGISHVFWESNKTHSLFRETHAKLRLLWNFSTADDQKKGRFFIFEMCYLSFFVYLLLFCVFTVCNCLFECFVLFSFFLYVLFL